MPAEIPFVISLTETTIAALNAIGDVNKKAGRGPVSRSAIIRCAVERLLADSNSTVRATPTPRSKQR